jgi:hypothetical protein
MALEITGKVFKVLAEQSGTSAGGKAWTKQEFVVETEEQYPRKICVTAMNEKVVPIVKTLAPGQQVTVHINLESREYQERWFTNVNVWRIDKVATSAGAAPATGEPFSPASITTEEPGDDLPF